jgi:hypothetical protein
MRRRTQCIATTVERVADLARFRRVLADDE